MVHMAKFDQNRLKDLGARRVDDRHTHRHTDKQTQAIIRAILRIGPIIKGSAICPISVVNGVVVVLKIVSVEVMASVTVYHINCVQVFH